jgi:hypothetical protein
VSEVSSESETPKKNGGATPVVKVVVSVLAFLLIAIVAVMWGKERDQQSQDSLAQKAEAVLGARLSDSRDGAKVTYMETHWDGDVLWMDFIMGDRPQEKCSTIVKISRDEQRFGFAPIKEVPFKEQSSAKGFCVTVSAGQPDGLSIEY